MKTSHVKSMEKFGVFYRVGPRKRKQSRRKKVETRRQAVPFISGRPDEQIEVDQNEFVSSSKSKRKTRTKIKSNRTEMKITTNTEVIENYERNIRRFVGQMNFDHSSERSKKFPIHSLKPMLKNFETNRPQQIVQRCEPHDFDKELFDFQQNTHEIEQPAMFTEYIRKSLLFTLSFPFSQKKNSFLTSGIFSKTS